MHAREKNGDAWQERLSPAPLQRSKKTNEFACTRTNSEFHRPHGCRVNSESPSLAGDTGICKEYARTREIRVIQSAGIEHRRVGCISGFVSVTRRLLVRPHRWGRDVGRRRAVPVRQRTMYRVLVRTFFSVPERGLVLLFWRFCCCPGRDPRLARKRSVRA